MTGSELTRSAVPRQETLRFLLLFAAVLLATQGQMLLSASRLVAGAVSYAAAVAVLLYGNRLLR
jgi:hypothetical protein